MFTIGVLVKQGQKWLLLNFNYGCLLPILLLKIFIFRWSATLCRKIILSMIFIILHAPLKVSNKTCMSLWMIDREQKGGHLLFNLQRFQQFKNRQFFLSFSNCSQIYANLNTYLWILVFCNRWEILNCFI